jgi:hypothetical protein
LRVEVIVSIATEIFLRKRRPGCSGRLQPTYSYYPLYKETLPGAGYLNGVHTRFERYYEPP